MIKDIDGQFDELVTEIEQKLDNKQFSEAKKQLNSLRKGYPNLDDSERERITEAEIECAKGIDESMLPIYELLMARRGKEILKIPDFYTRRDQFGLSALHYAIMLDDFELACWMIGMEDKRLTQPILGMELPCFALQKDFSYDRFSLVFRFYDDVGKRLWNSYERDERQNKKEKIVENGSKLAMDAIPFLIKKQSLFQGDIKNSVKSLIESMDGTDEELVSVIGDDIKEFYKKDERMEQIKKEFEKKHNATFLKRVVHYGKQRKEVSDAGGLSEKLLHIISLDVNWISELYSNNKTSVLIEDSDFFYIPEKMVMCAKKSNQI